MLFRSVPATAITNGGFGAGASNISIGGNAATGNAAVGSAGGALNLASRTIVLDAINGYAQAGFHGAGGGAINVTAKGSVTVRGNTATAARFAQIGNGSAIAPGSGNVVLDAASYSGIAASVTNDIAGGNVRIYSRGTGVFALDAAVN